MGIAGRGNYPREHSALRVIAFGDLSGARSAWSPRHPDISFLSRASDALATCRAPFINGKEDSKAREVKRWEAKRWEVKR